MQGLPFGKGRRLLEEEEGYEIISYFFFSLFSTFVKTENKPVQCKNCGNSYFELTYCNSFQEIGKKAFKNKNISSCFRDSADNRYLMVFANTLFILFQYRSSY